MWKCFKYKRFNETSKRQFPSHHSLSHSIKIFSMKDEELEKELRLLRLDTRVSNSHINLQDSLLQDSQDYGKAFIRGFDGNKSILIPATREQVMQSDVIAFGGIDFDDRKHISALLKSAATLFNSFASKKDFMIIGVHPNVPRKERYEALIEYNKNKLFFPLHIKLLVDEYILPKYIVRGELVAPKNPFTILTFSAAGRELFMMENYLRQVLVTNYGCSPQDLFDLLSYMRGICIAYAFDGHMLPDYKCPKTIIFSLDDIGVLKPQKLVTKYMECFLKQQEGNGNKAFIIFDTRGKEELNSHPSFLILLGQGFMQMNIEDKLNINDHSLPHYIDAILRLPSEVQQGLVEFLIIDSDYSRFVEHDILGKDASF